METFFTLQEAKVGKTYTIVSMCKSIEIKTKTRLFELGFFENEKVKILAKSLLGGVLLVEINNTVLTLRKTEAGCVVVK